MKWVLDIACTVMWMYLILLYWEEEILKELYKKIPYNWKTQIPGWTGSRRTQCSSHKKLIPRPVIVKFYYSKDEKKVQKLSERTESHMQMIKNHSVICTLQSSAVLYIYTIESRVQKIKTSITSRDEHSSLFFEGGVVMFNKVSIKRETLESRRQGIKEELQKFWKKRLAN